MTCNETPNSGTLVTYDDANGWPVSADGRGGSLILVQPDGDPNNPQNWRASTHMI